MAVINEVQFDTRTLDADTSEFPVDVDSLIQWARSELARELWKWFEQNKNTEITKISWWFFSVTVRVGHLRALFEMLLGPPPAENETT